MVKRTLLIFALSLLLPVLACTIPGTNATPTPPLTPTPPGDTLFFTTPYSIRMEPGEEVPGTEIFYVGRAGNLYELTVEGLEAFRSSGDSLTWQGVVAPAVVGGYRLRLQELSADALQLEGDVNLAIFNPAPVEIPPTSTPQGSIYFGPIPVNYVVPEGARIPGTTLVYVGAEDEIAQLSGTAAYPYFALDDSLLWLGKLRENIFIRYNVRIIALNEHGLWLDGIAELWVAERS
ncbi:MAG: hypothetical protein R3272_10355 [Candidatus Promineifilaceae bacterium]|nr:hypothetical protein [Candidatus Promineifilaceae bacterium]